MSLIPDGSAMSARNGAQASSRCVQAVANLSTLSVEFRLVMQTSYEKRLVTAHEGFQENSADR
jgi:hypothetical protein